MRSAVGSVLGRNDRVSFPNLVDRSVAVRIRRRGPKSYVARRHSNLGSTAFAARGMVWLLRLVGPVVEVIDRNAGVYPEVVDLVASVRN